MNSIKIAKITDLKQLCQQTYISIKNWVLVPSEYLRMFSPSDSAPGAGAGKGGGPGGSIRESGGGLGKYAAANEEGYFYNKEREQLQKFKDKAMKEERKTGTSQKEEK